MQTFASANLACDFIVVGLNHGYIVAEWSDFFWGESYFTK